MTNEAANKACKRCKKNECHMIPIFKPLKPTNEPQEQVVNYYLCDECYNTPFGMS